ncbi:Hsp20/alpha crystallin family protein [Lewinella cohaerens]|uniref:Hsp20/alpha crystallin family protein n=1 Tax=Lewinella cohaerens TaxID=70995 RepID=UPI0003714CCF|nr:Hsp20/alpha crystallin family protein [Lewinella cohaerens]
MGLVRFNPNLANRVFDEFFNNVPARTNFSGTLPAVNVKETEDDYAIELAVPGLKKEDFKVEINEGVLTIAAERKTENEEKKEGYTRREFSFTNFTRRFTLPETADEKGISASYTDGILVLNLPKKEEAKPQPARLIEVG